MNTQRAWLWFMIAAAPTAWAQENSPATVDPVLTNFREYRAALERNDLPAAETAAAAALAASEASQGRRTAILAFNLANLRLELTGTYDALSPARTAHSLALAAPDAGVDPLAAALTLGRAEIAAGDAAGAERLLAAFTAEGAGSLETDVYNAAVELGLWGITAQQYLAARQAWATAARLAHTTDNPTFARARALTGEGAAIFLYGSDREVPVAQSEARALQVGTPDTQAANDAFAEAQRLLMPIALADDVGPELTVAGIAYAQAMAWQSALFAKLQNNDQQLPSTTRSSDGALDNVRGAYCELRTIVDPQPVYPQETLERYGVGAVVVHLGLDTGGAVVSRTIAAAIPSGPLADAVEAVVDQWRVEKDPASPADCRMPSSWFTRVRFVLE